ncbi:MAG: sulfite exporter TauE/SafE family protein [Candidatus Kapabacteria bacterium]|nr:sulfite exporter TauE/SafE family protein [Candidatus Kapabacteria bacterium]
MDIFNIYLPIAQQNFNLLLLVTIGFCVGVLGGFFGVGGAWIVTPALNIFGFPMPYAIGTDFAHIFGKSIVSTKKHNKMGNVDWKLGFFTMIGTIPGVEVGAQVIMFLERIGLVESIVRWVYIFMLIGLGIFMIYDYAVIRKKREEAAKEGIVSNKKSLVEKIRDIKIPPMVNFPRSNIASISIWTIVFVFFLAGFISGFLGVGGGFIRMPTLIYMFGLPTAVAVGTDLFIVMLDGAYGCFTYSLKGRTDLIAAILMLVGAAIGAQIGVTAVKYIRGYGIRLLFALMILFAGISVILKQVQVQFNIPELKLASGIVIMGSATLMCVIITIKLISAAYKEKKMHS